MIPDTHTARQIYEHYLTVVDAVEQAILRR